jgi:1-acyl-sn-glycerol-3-phosphate acyltransferase
MSQSSLLKSARFAPFFTTQFLGAFNDNIYKNTLMLIITFAASDALGMDINVVLNLAAGLFILPFFLFSAIAGQLTDKYEKSMLMRRIKLVEIIIMGLAAIALSMQWWSCLIILLFLMGTQSAFFGPAKYAILPQHLEKDELVGGNALVEAGTFIAILLGTIGAGLILQFDAYLTITAAIIVLLACFGYVSSRYIPEAPSSARSIKITWNPISSTIALIKTVRRDRPIYLAVMAISWFWFIGAAYLTQFPNFAKEVLHGDASVVTLLLSMFTVGIGLGSMICEKLSHSRIELGIVPLGALGITLFGLDLFFAIPVKSAVQLSWLSFFESVATIRMLIDLLGIGFFGGIFIVPLYAYVQRRSSLAYRARTISVINILNALFMVASAIVGIIFLGYFELSIAQFFAVLAIMNLVVCCYIFAAVDEFTIRFVVWMLSHSVYRVKHHNLSQIPEHGPAILVCNHVSFVDALLIAGASPRPIRFVMDHAIFNNRVLGWFFRLVRAIPIAPQHKDSSVYEAAFVSVSEALRANELVCIFPEGKITQTGEMNDFKQGIELIIARDPVPVVPMALQGLWGSIFSHKDAAAFTKAPKRFWSKVNLNIGSAMKPDKVNVLDLQAKVMELRGGGS